MVSPWCCYTGSHGYLDDCETITATYLYVGLAYSLRHSLASSHENRLLSYLIITLRFTISYSCLLELSHTIQTHCVHGATSDKRHPVLSTQYKNTLLQKDKFFCAPIHDFPILSNLLRTKWTPP